MVILNHTVAEITYVWCQLLAIGLIMEDWTEIIYQAQITSKKMYAILFILIDNWNACKYT